jgi:signal transduction histidine kinase
MAGLTHGRERTPATTDERVESEIATGRALLATISLLVVLLLPSDPLVNPALTYGMLGAYALYSYAVAALVRHRRFGFANAGGMLHAIDVPCCAALTIVTAAASGPLFFFLVFVLVTSAYRWGLWETVATAVAGAWLLVLFTAVFANTPQIQSLLVELGAFRWGGGILYLMPFAVVFGYLAESEKRRRAESVVAARILSRVQAGRDLRGTLDATATELLRFFNAKSAVLVLRQLGGSDLYRWESAGSEAHRSSEDAFDALEQSDRETYFFPVDGDVWYASSSWRNKPRLLLAAIGDEESLAAPRAWDPPGDLIARHAWRSHLGLSLRLGDDWDARLFLLDPRPGMSMVAAARLFRRLVGQIAPAMYAVALLDRWRARVGAVERARLAHELHDGVIQSIVALEMNLDVVRRNASGSLAGELGRLQEMVREEVVNLRELMDQMKSLSLDPRELIPHLEEKIARFSKSTGINTSFVCDVSSIDLDDTVCHEIARIVREALVNVRKHSGAQHVKVRFSRGNGRWLLAIEDDGRGFPFSGRVSNAELKPGRRAPAVIGARVRALGGTLEVESQPGHGARLEISIPERAHE